VLAVASCFLLPRAAPAEPWRPPDVSEMRGGPPPSIQPARPRVRARHERDAGANCGFPWNYSQGLRRCVCTREGYSLQEGTCAPVTAAVAPVKGEAAASPDAETESPKALATRRAQRCFTELGLYKGPVDGLVNGDTWTAYWYFKHANGLARYRDFRADAVQQKIGEVCKTADATTELAPAPAAAPPAAGPESEPTPTEPEATTAERAPLPVPAQETAPPRRAAPDMDCLAPDLLAVLRRAHGAAVKAKACEQPACLPAPKGLSQPDLAALEARGGVTWCSGCVAIDGRLALDDVERIERAGNLQLCATPPRQLPRAAGLEAGERAYTRVRELYRSFPPAGEDTAAIAVIIGNRAYATVPTREASRNDADAVYAILTEHLGFAQDNVILLRDAKKSDFERLFGAGEESEGELARLVRAHPGARVLLYYSGLGATDAAQSETYLLPVDTERFREERSGYPLSALYAGLAKLEAESVLVLLETEFTRDQDNYVLPPNLPETVKSALPAAALSGVTVMAAADRGQRSLIDPTYGVGLFTRYLIEALAGKADLPPIGNGDGKLDSAEIYVFTAEMVQRAARKTYGLLQNPVYSGSGTLVVSGGDGGDSKTAHAGAN
jgi:hypothetical protein